MRLMIEVTDPEVITLLQRVLASAPTKSTPAPPAVDQRALDAANTELDELPLLLRTARKAVTESTRRKFALTQAQMNSLLRIRHERGNQVADKLLEEYRVQFADKKAEDQKAAEARLVELTRKKRELTEIRRTLKTTARKKPRSSDASHAILREVVILGAQAFLKGGKR